MSRRDPFKKPEKIFTEWVKSGNRRIQHVYYLYKDGTWAVDKDTYGMTVYKVDEYEPTNAVTNHDHCAVRSSFHVRIYAVNDIYGIKIHLPYD